MKHYYKFGIYYNIEELQNEEGYIIKEFAPGEIKPFDLVRVIDRVDNVICTCEWYHIEDVNGVPQFNLTYVILQDVDNSILRKIPVDCRITATSLEEMDLIIEKFLNNVNVLKTAFEMDQYNLQDMTKLKNMIKNILYTEKQ